MFYAGFLWWRNLFLPVFLLWEIIAYETRNEGLKQSESFVKYQEAKNVGEFEWGFFERLVLMCLYATGPHTSTFFWKLIATWPHWRPCCTIASFTMGRAHRAAGLWGEVGGSWRWWRGLASSPVAVVQPALPVYRTLWPRALHPWPPSSFLIVFLKSCGNNSLWKHALAFKNKKKNLIHFLPQNCKLQLSVSKGRFSRGELSCSSCIPPPSLHHRLSANAAWAPGQVAGSAQASSPAAQLFI